MTTNEHANGERSDFLVRGDDGFDRCGWSVATPLEQHYHDTEWGRPLAGESEFFERLVLEAFQAGLSWRTILQRREAFRAAFCDFDVDRVAALTDDELTERMDDPGIIRNRAKIFSTRRNALATIELRDAEGLNDFIWAHAPAQHPAPVHRADIPAITDASTALAKALKRRGFVFIGPTSAYALMQATGMVNDHVVGCSFRSVEV